jgi:hypothetical protein
MKDLYFINDRKTTTKFFQNNPYETEDTCDVYNAIPLSPLGTGGNRFS